jgi:hypothetical protein
MKPKCDNNLVSSVATVLHTVRFMTMIRLRPQTERSPISESDLGYVPDEWKDLYEDCEETSG